MSRKERIMSGMRPTGKLHLGHYIGVLNNWCQLQDEYDCFFGVADWHALTTKYDATDNLKQDVKDVVLDWLACGIDPEKSTIYVQSLVPQTAELHLYLSMVTPQNWVERDPTLKDMAKILREKGGDAVNVTYGLLGYPVLMSADIMTFNANVVPVGVDQLAHLEMTRDVVRRFNNIYKTDFFVEPKPKMTTFPLLKGVDGQKMGKSFNNDIKISDDEATTTKKIMQAITDRSRIRKDDLGHTEQCEVAFEYYKAFAEDSVVCTVKSECEAGKRGCADCKRQLAAIINEHFAPVRAKRLELMTDEKRLDDIIADGSRKARVVAQDVIQKVRGLVKMY